MIYRVFLKQMSINIIFIFYKILKIVIDVKYK